MGLTGSHASSLEANRRVPNRGERRQAASGRHGPIAQLVERTADNREVSGSNPLRPTIPEISGAVAQLGERLVCNQEVAGSNPVSSTSPMGFEWRSRQRSAVPEPGSREGRAVVPSHEGVTAGRLRPRLIDNRRSNSYESVKGVVPTMVFHAV